MKNIFKFMGLALVAGSLLFTACKKDEVENNDTTTPETPTSYAKITWDGTVQNMAVSEGTVINGNGFQILEHVAAAGINGEEYVSPLCYTDVVLYQGNYYLTEQVGLSQNFPNAFMDANDEAWYPEGFNAQPTYGTFDATTGKFSCTLDLEMYNYNEFYASVMAAMEAQGLTNEDLDAMSDEEYDAFIENCMQGVSTKNLVVDLKDIVFTAAQ